MRKKLALFLSSILILMSCLYSNRDAAVSSAALASNDAANLRVEDLVDMDELYGWATVSAEGMDGVTGGGNLTPQVVTTLEEFTRLAAGDIPRVIVISGTITCENYAVDVGSNKTIVGIDGNATIHGGINMKGVSNIIISNLNFHGFWPNPAPDDCISVRDSHHLWFNHLNIWNAGDGNMDLTMGSNYMTVSWCKFWYTDESHPHRQCSLVGSGTDHVDTDKGKLKVTYHHNWFADLVDQRMPSILFGEGHVYNNYYTAEGSTYCIGVGCYASVLVENNYFKNVNNPHQFLYTNARPAYITATGNVYDNTKGARDAGFGGELYGDVDPFTDPPYEYELDPADGIPTIVANHAGPQDVLNATPTPSKTPKPSATPTPSATPKPTPVPTASPPPQVTDNPITYDKVTDTYSYHGANSDGSNAFLIIGNPFKGLDFSEQPTYNDGHPNWKKGVTISYWVYVPTRAVDAAVLNFNLANDRQMDCQDKVHYDLCQSYSVTDETYSLGTAQIYVDALGREYTVLDGYGENVRYNPNYPAAGYYAADVENGTIPVYPKDADANDDTSWTYVKYIGLSMYESYGKRFDETDGEHSQIGEANISGSLSLYASGTVGFRQDDEKGVQLNPNLDGYGLVKSIQNNNQFYYWGNGGTYTLRGSSNLTPVMKEKNEWHFVVAVIQNDWIQYYMDGKEMTTDYLNWRRQSAVYKYVAGKSFNLGYGMKKAYMTDSPFAEDANSMTMLDFISDEDTVLTVGGLGRGAENLGQNTIGTPDGVKVKDLTFYVEPIAAESIKEDNIDTELIPIELPWSGMLGDVDEDGQVKLADAQLALRAVLNIISLDEDAEKTTDVNGNGKIELADAQKILRVALGIITF